MTAMGVYPSASGDSKTAEPNAKLSDNEAPADKPVDKPSDDMETSDGESFVEVQKREPRIFKIIVIGDSNVGKTCLTYRFCEGGFPKKVEATIGVDFREKTVEIGGDMLKLQLWDTAGQERFRRSMVPHYYRNVHAVVYVYDMTNRDTFLSLKGWLSEYSRHSLNHDAVPRILVGNKCDLSGLITVPSNEAQMFADAYSMPVFETSALDRSKADHVESIFMTIAHKLKESKPMMGSRYGLTERTNTQPQVVRYTAIGHEKKPNCAC